MKKISNSDHDNKKLLRDKQNLIEEKERMEIILATLNTGLAPIDPDLKFSWVNDKLREIYPIGEPVGKKCAMPFPNTAYNLSAHGPIIPLGSNLLVLLSV